MSTQQLVETYIKLRDAKKSIDDAAKAKTAKLVALMDQIEAQLLADFDASGVESLRTGAGTAYKSLRTSATVADWPAAFGFIQANGLWDMLERRVSKEAVETYRQENGALPPGVNYNAAYVINIRRS